MSDLETRSRARLTELVNARARFIADARARLTAFDAAIAELTVLLEPAESAEVPESSNGVADLAATVIAE